MIYVILALGILVIILGVGLWEIGSRNLAALYFILKYKQSKNPEDLDDAYRVLKGYKPKSEIDIEFEPKEVE